MIDWGISQQDFTTSEAYTMFGMMLGYYSAAGTAGSVWGPYALANTFPTFPLYDDPGMTLEALCLEVRANRLRAEGSKLLLELGDMMNTDPIGAITLMHQKAADLQNDCTPKKTDVHFADGFARVVDEMNKIGAGVDVSVCPWPWFPIQRKTMGIRKHDYIVFFGRPKSMKSWILCYLAAWFFEHNKRILIYSKEMPPDEIWERVGCVIAGVDYERFVTGTLVPDERYAVYNVLEFLQVCRSQHTVVCLSAKDAPGGNDTVAWLASKVEKYQPHAVFVDGLYLMKDQQRAKVKHERVRNISNDLRQLILHYDVPIIGTVQANRDAAKNEEANTDEIAFSDSLGQDCTHLIRVINEKNADTIALVMSNVARRFKLNGFRIYGIPAVNFSVKDEELTAKEADRLVRKEDADTKEAVGKHSKSGNGQTSGNGQHPTPFGRQTQQQSLQQAQDQAETVATAAMIHQVQNTLQ